MSDKKVKTKKAKDAKPKGALREWTESIIIAAVLAIFVRTFFFQVYKIPTTSMVPTLRPGDKIFVSKLVYGPLMPFTSWRFPGLSVPGRGEVVVFVPPHEKESSWFGRKAYIKRLIGLSGEKVLIKDGNIYINGEMVVDSTIARNYYYNQGEYGAQNKEITIPEGKYFFLGDNSISSSDGRDWGFVDQEDIIGKAIFIWWSPKRIGMIE